MSNLSLPMYSEERKTVVQFEVVATRNDVASDRMGRAMFDKILRIYITNPGQKDVQTYEVEREYAEGHPLAGKIRKHDGMYEKYGKFIEAFKRDDQTQAQSGTPIGMWTMADVRMAATFKHLGIHTVEQLADLNDAAIGNIGMGGREWVRKAKDWLQSAHNSALATQLSSEKKHLQDQLASMQAQIAELAEAMEELPQDAKTQVQETIKRKRGRPPKVAA